MASLADDRRSFELHEEQHRSRLNQILASRGGSVFQDPTYRIGASDELTLAVFEVPELNLTTKVSQAGLVVLPLLGTLQVEGLTEGEFRELVTERLKTFMHDPQVSIAVSNYSSQRVAILGAVRSPGYYPLRKGANTILELLSQAGGVTEKAGNFITLVPAEDQPKSQQQFAPTPERAQLGSVSIRPVSSRAGAGIEMALDQVFGTSGDAPFLLPVRGGDMVIVPEAGKVMVEGEVQTIGTYDLGQQMTLLGALAAAGGISYAAKVDEIEVIREITPGKRVHLVLSLEAISNGTERDVRLRNGDIVRVPSDSGRRMSQGIFESFAKMINIGVGGTYSVR
jgi:polysaccharide export outer membrane protein